MASSCCLQLLPALPAAAAPRSAARSVVQHKDSSLTQPSSRRSRLPVLRSSGLGSRRLSVAVRASASPVDEQKPASDPSRYKSEFASAISEKDSEAAKAALSALKDAGAAKGWSSVPKLVRRAVNVNEITRMGVKNAESLAIPSERNNLAFLVTVVGSTSVVAVLAGQLPGDWGFFVPYLTGGISLAVLAIGSTAPGLLQVIIDKFSRVFPDYNERILLAYLLGLPVTSYSLDLGREHVNLVDTKLQKRLLTGFLEPEELDRLSVVSMAGLAAEGLRFDKVMGQTADLLSLQRMMNRTKPRLSKDQQQSLTRWAVYYAAYLLKENEAAGSALRDAMARKASVLECIEAMEAAKSSWNNA
eukprot:jgi/Chlat1/5295/Chrsp35S05196